MEMIGVDAGYAGTPSMEICYRLGFRERETVDQHTAGRNRTVNWLRRLEALRQVSPAAPSK